MTDVNKAVNWPEYYGYITELSKGIRWPENSGYITEVNKVIKWPENSRYITYINKKIKWPDYSGYKTEINKAVEGPENSRKLIKSDSVWNVLNEKIKRWEKKDHTRVLSWFTKVGYFQSPHFVWDYPL